METKIKNSIVATDNSMVKDAAIKSNNKDATQDSSIENSVVAQNGSQITNATIDITKEKRKSFWNGFSIGGIIASMVASAIWYFIQKIIE